MIPLESTTAILPRMPTGRTITREFSLTIIKPPVLEVKARASPSAVSSPVYRLLRSRNQRRNSSASTVRSGYRTMNEHKESMTERVEVFELKETGQSLMLNSRQHQVKSTLPENKHYIQETAAPSRQSNLISSAKERHVCTQEGPLELMPELEQDGVHSDRSQLVCNSIYLTEESGKTDNFPAEETDLQSENVSGMDPKQSEILSSEKVTDKKTRKKSCKSKRTQFRKRKNSVKKGPGATGIFARLVGSHVQKKQQGQLNSNEWTKQRASSVHQVRDTSPNKYLNIQKLHAAYTPKKNNNKNSTVVLPRVSNNSLTKDNAVNGTSSPREEEQELENVSIISPRTSSPWKLLNPDNDKVKKIYLSETHSGMIAGIPCAPPCTPNVDELKKVEYIPSLTDIKSQRAIKTRLVNLGNKMRAGEQRRKEKALKEEQKRAYGAVLQLKQRQRAEIYALNKVMTELENENFRKFMEENSAESLPV